MSTTLKQKRRQKRRQRQLRPQTQAQSTAQPPKAFLLLEIFFRSKQLQIATTLLSTLVLLAIFMPNFFQGIQQATVAFGEQTQTVEESSARQTALAQTCCSKLLPLTARYSIKCEPRPCSNIWTLNQQTYKHHTS